MKLIVGLGNPGKEFEKTRHNLGFMFLDYLQEMYHFQMTTKKFDAYLAHMYQNNEKILLAKPQTYMNLSGESVRKIKDFYQIEPENILVVFDDLDIPFGEVRYKQNGSGGTHNGMKHIVQRLNTKNFPRLKIGIGGIKQEKQDLKDFVLQRFNKQQLEELKKIFEIGHEKLLNFLDN